MTALEHFNNLAAYLLAPEEEGGKKYTYTEIADMLHEIIKALTPPTSDEVCEELNKWYSDVVDYVFIHGVDDFTYDEKNKRFYKRMLNSPHEMTICRIDTNGCMELREPLPPHLIELIGRFYQGEVQK